jgi:hypothetical protein
MAAIISTPSSRPSVASAWLAPRNAPRSVLGDQGVGPACAVRRRESASHHSAAGARSGPGSYRMTPSSDPRQALTRLKKPPPRGMVSAFLCSGAENFSSPSFPARPGTPRPRPPCHCTHLAREGRTVQSYAERLRAPEGPHPAGSSLSTFVLDDVLAGNGLGRRGSEGDAINCGSK